MTQALVQVTAFFVAFGSLAALSLSLNRHYAEVYGKKAVLPDATRKGMLVAGYTGLGLVMVLLLSLYAWGYGLILWFGIITAAALAVISVLHTCALWLTRIAILSSLLGLACGIVAVTLMESTH